MNRLSKGLRLQLPLQEEAEQLMQKLCSWLTQQSAWKSAGSRWLYGLAARINKPPSAATSAELSSVLKFGRQQLSGAADGHCVPEISIIMAIAGAYFRQDQCMVGLCRDDYD